MNKRADKILSIYWFIILAIIAGGIFGMVYIFYGTPYDVRAIEANVLLNNVADCVSYSGRINTNLISNNTVKFQGTGADFLKACHLNFDTIEWTEQQYYTELNFYRLSDLTNSIFSIKAGNNKWLTDCQIQDESMPQCINKTFYSVDDANNQYIIKILSVVRKSDKNVKL